MGGFDRNALLGSGGGGGLALALAGLSKTLWLWFSAFLGQSHLARENRGFALQRTEPQPQPGLKCLFPHTIHSFISFQFSWRVMP